MQSSRDSLRSRQQDGFRSASARQSVLRRARGEARGAGVERLVLPPWMAGVGAVGVRPVLRRLVLPSRRPVRRSRQPFLPRPILPRADRRPHVHRPFHPAFGYVHEPGKAGGRPLAVTRTVSNFGAVERPPGETRRGLSAFLARRARAEAPAEGPGRATRGAPQRVGARCAASVPDAKQRLTATAEVARSRRAPGLGVPIASDQFQIPSILNRYFQTENKPMKRRISILLSRSPRRRDASSVGRAPGFYPEG